MKLYVREISETKNHIVVDVYNSAKKLLWSMKLPKYFLGEAEFEEGDEITLSVKKKATDAEER
jgi:hypothetical protein